MANKTCLLVKAKQGESEKNGLTINSYKELDRNWRDLIIPVLKNSEWGEDTAKFKFGFKEALRKLGAMYHGKDLNALVRYIKEDYINNEDCDNDWMELYIPAEGLKNAISKRYQAAVGNQNSNRYDETKDEEDTSFLPSKFLEDTFGKDANLKNKLKQEVTHKLLNTFIIDRENGKLVADILEANINARKHKQQLFDVVCDYIGMSKTELFDIEGNYTGAMDSPEFKSKMKSAPGGAFNTWEFTLIQSYGNNPNMKKAYDAYTSWFTLKNYDNFINLLIGSAVGVHPNAKGKLVSGNVYTFNDKSGANITSWRTDDNIMLSQEVSALVQSLVTSTPLLRYGIINPTGLYLKFEDFYRITTKIKDLTLNPDSGILLKKRQKLMDVTSEEDKNFYKNYSLCELINKIRFNPQLYTRLVFQALANDLKLMEELKFTPEEQDKIYSLYKGIYSPYDQSSINYIQNQLIYKTNGEQIKRYSHNQQDYYSMITQTADSMFTVNFLQYYENNGVITVRTLRDLTVDNGRRNIEQVISNLNSRRIIQEGFDEYHMKPWKARPLFKKDSNSKKINFEGISFKIGDYYFKLSELGNNLEIFFNEGQDNNGQRIYYTNFLSILKTTSDLLPLVQRFIDAQMGLDLTGNNNFLEALNRIFNGMSIPELLKLSGKILMNKYLSNKSLIDENGNPLVGYSKNMLKLYSYYAGNKDLAPKYNSNLNEINLLPDKDITQLERIAKAKTLVTGEALSTQVRDAEGNMLSSQTLSRLLGNITAQWEEIRQNNGACSEFSILKPGMFLGHYTSKELKATMGNKAETLFTVAELAQGAFLYDFVTGLVVNGNVNGKGVYHDGIVGFYPSVNSDKGTIGRMIVNLGMNCKQFGKPYSQLTVEEIEILTTKELGRAYQKAYNNIKLDYLKLLEWLATEKRINVNITPDDNFDALNTWCEKIKAKPAKMIFMWTREYNNTHVNNPIRIIENVHYVKGANGGILFNNTTRALMNRYSDPKQLHKFMDTKRTEVFTLLLSENVEFNLYSEGESSLITPKQYLRGNQFKDWVGTENGRMVIAKIDYKGNTYSITNKADFADFVNSVNKNKKNKNKLNVTDLYKNPHKLTEGDLHITLHPLLDKYNAYDYLFTLEFMLSGVGSHIAHPSKTKIKKTPIIWGHPGLGKSYSELNGTHSNEFMNWDTEFNHLRDLWIETNTGISKYIGSEKNPDFKNAKNDILKNWKTNPQFINFVKQSWENIKAKAQSLNKILIASPAMLLELFPKDFDLVIDMGNLDFIKRAKKRGDVNPGLWKRNMNLIIQNFKFYNATEKYMIVPQGKYLENLLNDGTLLKFLDLIFDNEIQEEAARFLALHKRNVSYTAAMLEFLLGQITGIPTFYNMAMIEDVPANTFTITGDTNENDSFDGATFVNPLVVYWENNSLNSARAGTDKKQFIHFYDDATGTGGIVKTAGFGVTNDRIRRYKFYRDINYNMINRKWVNDDETQYIMKGKGILQDFEGRDVDYGPVYFKEGNMYIERTIERYLGNNTYEVTDKEVDENGSYSGYEKTNTITVNSNYDVWQMFGGATSMEFVNDVLKFSEKSFKLTSLAASNYGEIISETRKAITADDVYQPMKHFDIHYMPTKGAVKQGAANINPYSSFFTREPGGLNFMRVRMMQAGIQLDKEHHADNSVLSLMTLVISAACSRGLMPQTSNEVYKALYELTKIGTKNFRDELGKLQIGINNSDKFDSAVTDVIMKTILTSTATDGDMMLAIARNIQLKLRQDKILNFDKVHLSEYDSMIPYSSPEIFRKIVSSLTVAMTKKGIKTKMPGVLSVLCPAHGIVKFYKVPVLNGDGSIARDLNNKPIYKRVTLEALENEYGLNIDDSDALNIKLDEILAQEPTFTDFHDTRIGYKYYIKETNGSERVVLLARPNSMGENALTEPTGIILYQGREIKEYVIGYRDLKDLAKKGIILNMQEWSRDGQDLNAYDVHFIANGQTYQLGDLDIVLDYFDVKSKKGDEQTAMLLNLLNAYGKADEFVARIAKDLLGNIKDPNTKKQEFINNLIHAFINSISKEEYTGLNNSIIRKSTINSDNYKINILQALDSLVNDVNIWVLDQSKFRHNATKALKTNLKSKQIIRDNLLNNIYSYINKIGIGFMNRTMQLTLDGISPSHDSVKVKIDGKYIDVDKSSIDITPFGIIMPKVFKHNFGLDDFDSIEDIKQDSEFFTRKIILKFGTHVESYPSDAYGGAIVNNFDLELKRNNGDHIYIRINDFERDPDFEISDLTNEITWYKQINPDGTIYRIDKDGNVMYQMFSDSDKIYLDRGGNEIIVTNHLLTDIFVDLDGNEYNRNLVIRNHGKWFLRSNAKKQVEQKNNDPIEFYLNSMGYSTINISEHSHTNVYNYIMNAASRSNSKLAQRFYNKITKLKDIKTQRKLIKKLNDYSGALTDGAELFKNEQLAHIAELGQEIRTSFLRSLDLVAARIPSLNLQSFMAMKTAAFDNPDINTAYVSIFLFYLQGSDLDIDAVSLLVFDINKSGLFVGHSPYYSLKNEELRKASESLPFPNGKKVEFTTSGEPTLISLIREDSIGDLVYNHNAPITINRDSNNIKLTVHLDTTEKIKKFGKILQTLSNGIIVPDDAHINTMLGGLKPRLLETADELRQFENELKRIVDDHNMYIKKSDNIKQERIIKNYAITQLYNIIIDPINLLESWSSVDTVTKPAKALGAKSDKASVLDTFTPGNFMNKFLSVNENMVGKDGIAICATGLKSFFALTQLYQQMLNDKELLPEADKLLKPVTIGGKTYKGLANAFSKRFQSLFENPNATNEDFSEEMLNFLFELLWASDAANEMSALLGLSTDNAKELILAKINAGTATLGMYLYGMAIGVPMNDLYNIINSPLGRRLVELTKGDYFNEDSGTRNIIGALDYLKNEPKLNRFDRINSEETFTAPSKAIIKELYTYYEINKNKLTSFTPIIDFIKNKSKNFDEALNHIRTQGYKYAKVFKDANKKKEYLAMYNRAVDFLKLYNSDLQLINDYALATYDTIYGTLYVYDDLETLALGADEMKTIGKVLHLNLEIYTTPEKLIDLVLTIEGFIQNRMRQINKKQKRQGRSKEFKDHIIEDAYVDLEALMTDPDKAQEYINNYDSVMQSFNVFRIITQDPHYRGYVESLLTAHKGLSKKSVKYNIIVNRALLFIKSYHVSDPNLKTKVIKNAENAVDLFFRESWMLQYKAPNGKKLIFTMDESTDDKPMYAFIDSPEKVTLAKNKIKMHLGTVLGDANYMMWMEKVVIPELKLKYLDNKFIQGLKPIIAGTSDLGVKIVHYGLPINMLPKRGDEYALDVFNLYKDAFNSTNNIYTDANRVDWNIKDMLYFYSLIAYKGKQGPLSLHGIFLDYEGDPVLGYRKFISEADLGDKTYDVINKFITDDMLIPAGSPYKGGSDILKYTYKKTETPYIVIKPKPEDYNDPSFEEQNDDSLWFGDYEARLYNGIPSEINYNYFMYIQPITGLEKKSVSDEILYTVEIDNVNYVLSAKDGKYRLKSIHNIDKKDQIVADLIVEYLKDTDIPVINTPDGKITINLNLFKQLFNDIINDCKP